jgi:hypothetical protein
MKAEVQTIYIAYAPDKGRNSLCQGQPLSVWTKDCGCPLIFWRKIWRGYTVKAFVTIPQPQASIYH